MLPIECGSCCEETESANIENISLYADTQSTNSQENIRNKVPSSDEFEIFIRKYEYTKNGPNEFTILVTQSMTIADLKLKIYKQENFNPQNFDLVAGKPLIEIEKTLKDYNITTTRTLSMVKTSNGGI